MAASRASRDSARVRRPSISEREASDNTAQMYRVWECSTSCSTPDRAESCSERRHSRCEEHQHKHESSAAIWEEEPRPARKVTRRRGRHGGTSDDRLGTVVGHILAMTGAHTVQSDLGLSKEYRLDCWNFGPDGSVQRSSVRHPDDHGHMAKCVV